jgi:N-acetylmuramoyl-L-alanine amidase
VSSLPYGRLFLCKKAVKPPFFPFSRPGKALAAVKGVVIHYVGNPGSSAMANRNYWENLKRQSPGDPKAAFASAHYIVGLSGEVIQTLPEAEMGYHVGAKAYKSDAISRLGRYPNNRAIGMELCHPKADGRFNPDTYDPAAELAAEICKRHSLGPRKDIWRHYDVTGKLCPKWFAEDPEAFERFKEDVEGMEAAWN